MPFSTTRGGRASYDDAFAPFFQGDGLPFADVLSADTIAEAFAAEQPAFGEARHSFWTPALTVWAFLSQVLNASKGCRAAVLRAFTALALSCPPADVDTGNYCRARAKLACGVLRRLTLHVGSALEAQALADWRWHDREVVLVDAFTASLADTPANQARYPQPNTQQAGLGFPLLRVLVLLSLATAACRGLAIGPYQGKETGESALLRSLLDQLPTGAIVVADRYYCSYFMVALLQAHGVPVVMRLHQRRATDLRRAQRLGANDYQVTWTKPKCPDWMDEATYAAVPETLVVRQLAKTIERPGYRVKELTVITTLLDAQTYASDEVLSLYQARWQVELDIRAIKATLQMDTLRCRTPDLVEKEIWAHFLGYNLVRKVAAQAAVQRGCCPRAISFAASQQAVVEAWSKLTEAPPPLRQQLAQALLHALGYERVGHRPGRCEPRALKRRPKKQKLLRKPRAEARADLLHGHAA